MWSRFIDFVSFYAIIYTAFMASAQNNLTDAIISIIISASGGYITIIITIRWSLDAMHKNVCETHYAFEDYMNLEQQCKSVNL